MELSGDSGKFVMDPNGYTRFEPIDTELAEIDRWISAETDLAEQENLEAYQDAADAINTYKATRTNDIIDGEMALMPAPLARIAVDQVVAWEYNTIMRPTPLVSMQPYFKDTYEIVVPPPKEMMGMMPGMPGMAGAVIEVSAEEAALYLEAGYDYKLRETLGFPSFVRTTLTDCATIGKCYAKVCWERDERAVLAPKRNGAIVDFSAYDEEYVDDGDGVHWYPIPAFNILKRVHEDDIDKAEMFQERKPCSGDDFYGRCLAGEFPLLNEKEYLALSKNVGEVKVEAQKQVESSQAKYSALPPNYVDLRLVWFYRRLKFEDEDGQTKIKKVSLMGFYHHGARKMCNIFRNPYRHQRRPYAVGYQLKDAHSDSGSSTTTISRWFQRVATHLTQAEIKNVFLSNNFVPWFDPDGPASGSFEGGLRLRPGKAVQGKFGTDWGVAAIGSEHQTIVPLLNLIRGWAREVQNMSAVESGDAAGLGRTPAGSISQLLQAGLQQPTMFLRGYDEFMRRVMILDIETRRQYQPLGEVIPTRDAATKAITNVPFRYPLGQIDKNMRISLTAADEAAAREHEPEQLMMLLNIWQQYTQFVASVVGPMKEASESEREFFKSIVSGGQALFDRIVTLMRTDREKFDLSGAIDAIEAEIQKAEEQMMADQAGGQLGATDSAAYGGGAVPEGAEPVNGGLEGMAGDASLPSGPLPPPEVGLQPEVVQ